MNNRPPPGSSAANVLLVMLIFSGVIIDKIGVKLAGIIYALCWRLPLGAGAGARAGGCPAA